MKLFVTALSVCLLGAFFGVAIRSQQAESPEGRAAKIVGLSESNYRRICKLVDDIKANKGKITESDFEFISNIAKAGTDDAKGIALTALAVQSKNSPFKIQSLQLAKEYLKDDRDGRIPAILVLKKFEDPSWRELMEKESKSANESTSEAALRILNKSK